MVVEYVNIAPSNWTPVSISPFTLISTTDWAGKSATTKFWISDATTDSEKTLTTYDFKDLDFWFYAVDVNTYVINLRTTGDRFKVLWVAGSVYCEFIGGTSLTLISSAHFGVWTHITVRFSTDQKTGYVWVDNDYKGSVFDNGTGAGVVGNHTLCLRAGGPSTCYMVNVIYDGNILGEVVTADYVNTLIASINSETTRRSAGSSITDVTQYNSILGDDKLYDMANQLTVINAVHCSCEADGGTDTHNGGVSLSLTSTPTDFNAEDPITAESVNEIDIDRQNLAGQCACDSHGCTCDLQCDVDCSTHTICNTDNCGTVCSCDTQCGAQCLVDCVGDTYCSTDNCTTVCTCHVQGTCTINCLSDTVCGSNCSNVCSCNSYCSCAFDKFVEPGSQCDCENVCSVVCTGVCSVNCSCHSQCTTDCSTVCACNTQCTPNCTVDCDCDNVLPDCTVDCSCNAQCPTNCTLNCTCDSESCGCDEVCDCEFGG